MSKPDYGSKEHYMAALTWIERNQPGGIALVARALSESGDIPVNQCDGCQRGLPLDANRNHHGPGGVWVDLQRCTKERYLGPDSL